MHSRAVAGTNDKQQRAHCNRHAKMAAGQPFTPSRTAQHMQRQACVDASVLRMPVRVHMALDREAEGLWGGVEELRELRLKNKGIIHGTLDAFSARLHHLCPQVRRGVGPHRGPRGVELRLPKEG